MAFDAFYHNVREQVLPLQDTSVDAQLANAGLQAPHCWSAPPCRAKMLTPLLDMINFTDDHRQQAEAAGALQAAVGEDLDFAAQLCTPDLRESLTRLLDIDDFCVAYPTARLISTLARCSQAA